MEWYYAESGQQIGPIAEEQLAEYARRGTIRGETLVWHAGLSGWRPYREVAAPPAWQTPRPQPTQNWQTATPAASRQAAGSGLPTRRCSACGRDFALADLAVYGQAAICGECKPGYVQRLRQGTTAATHAPAQTFRYAGFWIRFVALMIDGLILTVVFSVIYLVVGILFGISAAALGAAVGRSNDPGAIIAALAPFYVFILLFSVAIPLTYNLIFWTRSGATPGKMAVGIKVVTPEGGRITGGQAVGRHFGQVVSGMILYIGYMMAGWDIEKRSLHDRMAGTRVIYAR